MNAPEILRTAAKIIESREPLRDQGHERAMARAVRLYLAWADGKLTSELDGYVFMACVKLARAAHGVDRDNWIDGAAYLALASEADTRMVEDIGGVPPAVAAQIADEGEE